LVIRARDNPHMNIALGIGGALLGLLPFVFSPTKTFARGGVWRYVGAAVLVISMMLLFWTMRDLTGEGVTDDVAGSGITADQIKALEKLF